MKLILQSGVIPFFIKDNQVKVVLITSNETRQWIFPKGSIEKDLTSKESAAKEALEEAGVEGDISLDIFGEYNYYKHSNEYNVEMFLLRVKTIHDKWDEMRLRKREIFNLSEAVKIIKPTQLEIMTSFEKYMNEKGLL